MGFIDQLTEKPWVAVQGEDAVLQEGREFPLPTVTIGLRVFLAVATVVFSLLIVTYADRMYLQDWRALSEPWMLWLNTGLLVLSSVALQWTAVKARAGQMDSIRFGLNATGALSFAFLAGQVMVWQQLVAEGFFAATNPSVAFFYLLTAVHGVHLLGGLVAWGRTIARTWRRGTDAEQLRLSVELCAVYWHFLLIVWLVLFGLLLFT